MRLVASALRPGADRPSSVVPPVWGRRESCRRRGLIIPTEFGIRLSSSCQVVGAALAKVDLQVTFDSIISSQRSLGKSALASRRRASRSISLPSSKSYAIAYAAVAVTARCKTKERWENRAASPPNADHASRRSQVKMDLIIYKTQSCKET